MKKQKKIGYIAVVAIVLFGLFYDVVLFGGNIQFYAKWLQCGKRPLQTEMTPGGSIAWYKEGDVFAIMRTKLWFCSPIEAEKAGFSASESQQEFPHLKKESE